MAIHQEQDMNQSTDVAVTYTGNDDPYKDRIYRSGLTFTPGQTRVMPAPLAARFLRHSDVFKQAGDDAAKAVEQTKQPESTDQDTAQVLEQQKQEQDEQRQLDDARFALLDSIESMDRTAVIAWADQHYRQKIPGNVSVAKAREMARGYIDQYGMPA